MIIRSYGPLDTDSFARDYVGRLSKESKACVVGLFGDLGAGKTTFTQAVARHLGIQETVTSPTFVIEKIYDIEHPHFSRFIHIDAYRIEQSEEFVTIGWEKIVKDPDNLIFIEWPERVSNLMPDTLHRVTFTWVDEEVREIEYT